MPKFSLEASWMRKDGKFKHSIISRQLLVQTKITGIPQKDWHCSKRQPDTVQPSKFILIRTMLRQVVPPSQSLMLAEPRTRWRRLARVRWTAQRYVHDIRSYLKNYFALPLRRVPLRGTCSGWTNNRSSWVSERSERIVHDPTGRRPVGKDKAKCFWDSFYTVL